MKCGLFFIQLTIFFSLYNLNAQRIGNYIANGSFEEKYDCTTLSLLKTKQWMGIDSLCEGGFVLSVCNGSVPSSNVTYQNPHSGNSHLWTIFYYPVPWEQQRKYPKNRLKSTLEIGKTYCVRFYVNITNISSDGIDGFGAYFGDNSIDTIKYCNLPLSFLSPQVQNPQGNVISDTMNWIPITGTFTANGTEKFLLLGNFLANNAVSTVTINPYTMFKWTEVLIDDVSCIEVNLPAYAGRDTTIYLGDSTYIGREPDFAIDSGCVWYRLPTTTAIDTISGMWVKPNAVGSYTYVVRQELECSSLKWDTVVVKVRAYDVGIRENKKNNWVIDLYPNPAGNTLMFQSSSSSEEMSIRIFDITGREVLSKHLRMENQSAIVELNLANGSYTVKVTNTQGQTVTKKLVINR